MERKASCHRIKRAVSASALRRKGEEARREGERSGGNWEEEENEESEGCCSGDRMRGRCAGAAAGGGDGGGGAFLNEWLAGASERTGVRCNAGGCTRQGRHHGIGGRGARLR